MSALNRNESWMHWFISNERNSASHKEAFFAGFDACAKAERVAERDENSADYRAGQVSGFALGIEAAAKIAESQARQMGPLVAKGEYEGLLGDVVPKWIAQAIRALKPPEVPHGS